MNSANKLNALEAGLSPVKPLISLQHWLAPGLQPAETLKHRSKLSCVQTSDLQKLRDRKLCVKSFRWW